MIALFLRDLRIELRAKAGLASLLVLGMVILLVFRFALAGDGHPEIAAAAIWTSFLVAGTLGTQRAFLREKENDALRGLLVSPIDAGAIFLAKTSGTIVSLLLLEAFVVPLALLFFRVPPPASPLVLVAALVLGNVGFSALATLFAPITIQTRARDVLLPLILFPLLVPVLLGGVEATIAALEGRSPGPWLQILAAADAIFVTTGWLLFESVIRE